MELKDLLLTLDDDCDIGLYDEEHNLLTKSVSATPSEILKYKDYEVVSWRPAIFDKPTNTQFIRLCIDLKKPECKCYLIY